MKKNIMLLIIISCFLLVGGLYALHDYINQNNELKTNQSCINITRNTSNQSTNVSYTEPIYSNEDNDYNPDDYLSSEELKAKYPDMSDEELHDRFGERGPGGVGYTQEMVDEANRKIQEV